LKNAYTSSLTFTSGALGHRAMKQAPVVTGAAASLYGVVNGLATAIGPIRVNSVSPGFVDTELLGEGAHREGMVAFGKGKSPLEKIATVEEAAEAYLYLLRDSNVTGKDIGSDSGVLLGF
jgi:NAD(P)-dependent dehydrogenase (short-subunit alcohol dehydrogenase family)